MMIRVALLALIACGLAGFGTIMWMVMPRGDVAVASVAPVEKMKVIVIAKGLRPGSLMKSDDVVIREIEQTKLPDGAIMAEDANVRRSLVGAMARRAMVSGDVVAENDILRPADHGFLSAVLRPGFRAVTIAVDVLSGAAGLIWPGDRVDLILTQTMDEALGFSASRRIAAETVLRDVRVIDQQVVQGATSADNLPARTITLEVSSASAEQVQIATKLGKLSLAVRSAESGPSDNKDGTTWAGDVSSALSGQGPRPASTTMRVFQGSGDGKEFKF
jgi:pilus assembly protein CpaB